MSDPDLYQAHSFESWNEETGNVLWWKIPVQEPPYVGTPLDIGRGVLVTVQVGAHDVVQQQIGDVAGWPFDENDEKSLVWTRLPGAIRMPL